MQKLSWLRQLQLLFGNPGFVLKTYCGPIVVFSFARLLSVVSCLCVCGSFDELARLSLPCCVQSPHGASHRFLSTRIILTWRFVCSSSDHLPFTYSTSDHLYSVLFSNHCS